MMYILSINLFYGKKILMFSTYADFMSLNVDVPFFFFKALLYSSVQKTTSISNLREIKGNHILV